MMPTNFFAAEVPPADTRSRIKRLILKGGIYFGLVILSTFLINTELHAQRATQKKSPVTEGVKPDPKGETGGSKDGTPPVEPLPPTLSDVLAKIEHFQKEIETKLQATKNLIGEIQSRLANSLYLYIILALLGLFTLLNILITLKTRKNSKLLTELIRRRTDGDNSVPISGLDAKLDKLTRDLAEIRKLSTEVSPMQSILPQKMLTAVSKEYAAPDLEVAEWISNIEKTYREKNKQFFGGNDSFKLLAQLDTLKTHIKRYKDMEGEQSSFIREFGKFRTGEEENIYRVALKILREYEAASQELKGLSPTHYSTLQEMSRSVAEKLTQSESKIQLYEQYLTDARSEGEQYKKLFAELSGYIDFEPSPPAAVRPEETLDLLQSEKKSEAHQILRFGILVGHRYWVEGMEKLRDNGRTDVIEALRLDNIENHLLNLLKELHNFKDAELWSKRLQGGFSASGWLHDLFRAHELVSSYFSQEPAMFKLAIALQRIAEDMKLALQFLNVKVTDIKLFRDPKSYENPIIRQNASRDLVNIGEVKKQVQEKLKTTRGFIVDIEAVKFHSQDLESPGIVVEVNPSDWE